ncbi:Transmembrane 6 super member 1 [Chamberlinius hualienensis]
MPVHESNIRFWSPLTIWRMNSNDVKAVRAVKDHLLGVGGVRISKPTLSRQQTKHLDRQLTLRKELPNSCAGDSVSREYVTLPSSSTVSSSEASSHILVWPPPTNSKHALRHQTSPVTNVVRPSNWNMAKSRGGGNGGGDGHGELNRFNGFINKPARGWLYPDYQILEEGVCYQVRYVGCLEVNTSMKVLDFETRSIVAKECISRICEAGGLKTVDRKRKVDRKISRMLSEPKMEHAGADVQLVITSSRLELKLMDTNNNIAAHEMPNISFASGGDAETLDFVAYVAKNAAGVRACYVLECGGKCAQDVITTIGQAFELRFKEYLLNASRSSETTSTRNLASSVSKSIPNREENATPIKQTNGFSLSGTEDPDYYNDLPGKIPPEMTGIETVPSLVKQSLSEIPTTGGCASGYHVNSKDFSLNLIDLNSEPSTPNNITKKSYPEYSNDAVFNNVGSYGSDPFSPKETPKDPFDMQPFDASLSDHDVPSLTLMWTVPKSPRLLEMQRELEKEPWFHGATSRKDSENLLLRDGDFLVRESQGSAGQFVLTGMQNGAKKHLLLVDPEGVVRTKDKTFESVSHLVNYHRNNELPIISAESALLLKYPRISAFALAEFDVAPSTDVSSNGIGSLKLIYILIAQGAHSFFIALIGVFLLLSYLFIILFICRGNSLKDAINNWHFYVFSLFASTGVISFGIGLEYDGYISDFLSEYLRSGEPYLFCPFGAALCYFDGFGMYSLYLYMIYAISNKKSYRTAGLYWSGTIMFAMIVTFLGILFGKYGIFPSSFLNLPYLIIPFVIAWQLLRRSPSLEKLKHSYLPLSKRPLDVCLVIMLIVAAFITILRGVAVMENNISLAKYYLEKIEPVLILDDPSPFIKVQILVYLFYFLPIYVLSIYGLVVPGCSWFTDLTLIHAGAMLEGQFAAIYTTLHSAIPNNYKIPDTQEAQFIFWLVNIFVLLLPHLLLVRCYNSPKDEINNWHFYVFSLFATTSVIDFGIGLEQDGYISDFLSEYLRSGEPYLFCPFGAAICYFDGFGMYSLYLYMIYAISNKKSYRAAGLYWSGTLMFSMIVLFLGILFGKFGIFPSSFLNVPYLIIPFVIAWQLLRSSPSSEKVKHSYLPLSKRPLDVCLVVMLLIAAFIAILRGVAVMENNIPLAKYYLEKIEPVLMLNDPSPFIKIQILVYLFYFLPIYVLSIYGLVVPGCSWFTDLTLIHAGAMFEGQFAAIYTALHSAIPNKFMIPDTQEARLIFWLVNIFVLLLPHLLLVRCYLNKGLIKISGSTKSVGNKKQKKF